MPELSSTLNLSDVQVESERTELLTHPLVTSLLSQKWNSYGRIVFYTNLALYLIFVIFLTTFALVVPNPQSAACTLKKEVVNMTGVALSLPPWPPPPGQANANSPNVTLNVTDVDSLSDAFRDFINSSNIPVMNNMATLIGQEVCSNSSIRDEVARTGPNLIGAGDNAVFDNGEAQCGECGKLHIWN